MAQVTGHSLGAGTACLLAILLREEMRIAGVRRAPPPPCSRRPRNLALPGPCPAHFLCNSSARATHERALPRTRLCVSQVRGVGFATPPVVDKAAALGCKSYIWSVVNHTDVVPRASVRNVQAHRARVGTGGSVRGRSDGERGASLALRPHASTRAGAIARSAGARGRGAATQVLSGFIDGTLEILKAKGPEAAQAAVVALSKRVLSERKELPADLYVPGKVLYAYADGKGQYHAAVHDGTLPMLASIMPASTLITDHLGDQYITAVKGVQPKE